MRKRRMFATGTLAGQTLSQRLQPVHTSRANNVPYSRSVSVSPTLIGAPEAVTYSST